MSEDGGHETVGGRRAPRGRPSIAAARLLATAVTALFIVIGLSTGLDEHAAEVIVLLDEADRGEVVDDLDEAALTQIVAELPPDDAADVLGELPDEQREEILEHVPDEQSEQIEDLLEYEEDTAGGLMNTEYVALHANATVADAFAALRGNEELLESLNTLFLVDADEALAGVVPLARLFVASETTPLKELVTEPIIQVPVDEHQKHIVELFDKYNLLTLPVIDDRVRELPIELSHPAGTMEKIGSEKDLRIAAGAERVTTSAELPAEVGIIEDLPIEADVRRAC